MERLWYTLHYRTSIRGLPTTTCTLLCRCTRILLVHHAGYCNISLSLCLSPSRLELVRLTGGWLECDRRKKFAPPSTTVHSILPIVLHRCRATGQCCTQGVGVLECPSTDVCTVCTSGSFVDVPRLASWLPLCGAAFSFFK